MSFLENLFGGNRQVVTKVRKEVDKINSLGDAYKAKTDQELRDQIAEYRSQLKPLSHTAQQAKLSEILPDVFAITREMSDRVMAKRHFDVQLVGGIVLHRGQIAEMRTGEGKTLTATAPLILNALTGRGAHLVTVNDYLARWHASLMGPLYHALGLSVASIQHDKSFVYDPNFEPEAEEVARIEAETQGLVMDVKHMRPVSRQQAYAADITYGTNNEFGFDYLRDNMVGELRQMVQRELHFAIVDEVDSILIDEARTPLIISAPDSEPTEKYYQFAKLVEKIDAPEDYDVDEKRKGIALTEAGIEKLEKMLGVKNMYEEAGIITVHHIEQALRAKALFKRDRDYVSQNGEIVIVDEFTGRLMYGRRYSDGLHQAIEAKEGVKIQQESKTLATITFQNYFRMYSKLAGMTGTALTEAEEFFKIYQLDVVSVPTNRPMVRVDAQDLVYKTEAAKFEAITADIAERHRTGQPVLVGTVSIQKNEVLAEYLRKAGLKFELLNAKNHEREAQIISDAGRMGAITVATNIAGRGVDILLGGNPAEEATYDPAAIEEVRKLGGLHVIGTERHESRRIDNQLRGRAGRQGDPGSSQFYVSMEDDLMRLFGGARLQSMMDRLGLPADMPIENKLISRSIEQAQKRIEGMNFDTRKHVLEYDDIMNKQREVIYKKRRAWLEQVDPKPQNVIEADQDAAEEDGKDGEEASKVVPLRDEILGYVEKEITEQVHLHFAPDEDGNSREPQELIDSVNAMMPIGPEQKSKILELFDQAGDAQFAVTDYLTGYAEQLFEEKEKGVIAQAAQQRQSNVSTSAAVMPPDDLYLMRQLEKLICLQNLDTIWMQHLDTMQNLRDSVGLRGYGQKDPLVEYKREGFDLFQRALRAIEKGIARNIFKANIGFQAAVQLSQVSEIQKAAANSPELRNAQGSAGVPDPSAENIGRNDPCPCGSGKKWKKCGMLNTPEHQANMAKKNK